MELAGIAGGGILIILLSIAPIALIIFLCWKLGKYLGTQVSSTTGLILGVVLIVCGITIFVGIPCIVYSQKNKDKSLDLDFKINSNINATRESTVQETVVKQEDDNWECPYCAEIIKKKATICRFCGRTIETV